MKTERVGMYRTHRTATRRIADGARKRIYTSTVTQGQYVALLVLPAVETASTMTQGL
jgi:hypothetical protein